MNYLVLPCVKMETSADDALKVMREAARSALLVRDELDVFWFLDLGHLLSEIREGKELLADMAPGEGIIVATEGELARRSHESQRHRPLPSRIQQILSTANVPIVVIPGLSPESSEFEVVPTKRLPLLTGRRNPAGLCEAELAQTEMGVFTKTSPKTPSENAPRFDFALVAIQLEDIARQYLVPPGWCTCTKDSSHKYNHADHHNGEPCPQSCGGILDCP